MEDNAAPLNAVRPLLEQSVEIAAAPSKVWELVSDVTRMPEWSDGVASVRLRAGFDEVALGTEFTNRNVLGELEWTTHGKVVAFEPEQVLAFRIEENWAIWSFTLEPVGPGTRLTQRRETPEGISELSHQLTDGFMGGQDVYTETLLAGMAGTLEAIKNAAEA
ncbi:SRPBCC family protein [Nocardioides seonyuensis]|uniref:SRPBCC family protein n=1 Tax=Nocardioides seonyuensis TaxID=2518371 RepID=A0A4P7IEV6_9ACTN|nr:SRPBCC family protein [Nocardioides seonyuensis]QBX54487.1 SRPBCC family protein [Nocardioides seonyuensis]